MAQANPADPLNNYADVWDRKPVLRAVYQDFYDRLAPECGVKNAVSGARKQHARKQAEDGAVHLETIDGELASRASDQAAD